MHKKPLVAVLIFGLLVLTQSAVFAKAVPGGSLVDEVLLPRIARGIEKENPVSTDALIGTTTEYQAGVPRTGATFCSGDGYGAAIGQYGSWFYGDEFYAAYQDPEEFGSCSGTQGLYTFDVAQVVWYVCDNTDTEVFDFQPVVWDNGADAICPLPGDVLCAGPVYSVDFPGTGCYLMGLPIPLDPVTNTSCCVFDPYFAGLYAVSFHGPGFLGIVVDGDGTDDCWVYNDYGGGWVDLAGALTAGNPILFSEGYAFDQNECPGTPGVCDWEVDHGEAYYIYTEPDILYGLGIHDLYAHFATTVSCTLNAVRFDLYEPYMSGTPTIRASVYGNNGPYYLGRMYPDQFGVSPNYSGPNFIGYVDVPFASLTYDPDYTEVDVSSLGPYVSGPGEQFFISFSVSPNTPDPINDQVCFLSDNGGFSTSNNSGFYSDAYGDWFYTDEIFSSGSNYTFDPYLCCEYVEPTEVVCDNPGPDDWNTYAHDYNRTSATSIEVGDPCHVGAIWKQNLTGLNEFCGPTIADTLVYVSDANTLYSFGLLSGTPLNSISGLPHIFAANRGNLTVDGGYAYVTGGNAQSIGQWSADLAPGSNNWVNGLNYPPDPPDGPPLQGQCRYGVTAVYEAEPGVEVVVVGTEDPEGASPGGRLWCLETATGAAYGGWPTNPVILPTGIWEGLAYDGDDIYVSTANTSLIEGGVYRIDAATGAIVWSYTSAAYADYGYPGGLSLEGDYVYTASGYATSSNLPGARTKLNKSDGSVVWEFPQGRNLYSTPALGRNFAYIGDDNTGGLLLVDKNTGAALFNFAAVGVGRVTQHPTVTCDNYLFAGDRDGKWWLLDINGQSVVWNKEFPGIVNQTAVASGSDVAAVSVRSGNPASNGGMIAAFRFNWTADKPVAVQWDYETEINVPFGTGAGNAWSEPDVLQNLGCLNLNLGPYTVTDPPPDVVSAIKKYNDALERKAKARALVMVDADWTSYFNITSKNDLITTFVNNPVNVEMSRGDVAMEQATKALADSRTSRSRMAADASIVRTSAVSMTTPLAPGDYSALDFLYDGTALERGQDVEVVDIQTDDPDRAFFGNQPFFTITYTGGCLEDRTSITWNTSGAENSEEVYNYGALGDDDSDDDLLWGADPNGADAAMLYDGTWVLAGPLAPNGDSVQFYRANMYDQWDNSLFLGNPATGTDECRFDHAEDVHMGWKRTGGCPGTPEEIDGAWVRAYYVDSNLALGSGRYAAIGLNIEMTEVGAYDPLYGDFALLKMDMTERNGQDEDPVYVGQFIDWDVPPDFDENHGIISDNFNGYALWDHETPNLAYGFLDPRMPTAYCGVDPAPYSPHVIQEMGQRAPAGGGGGYDLWQGDGVADASLLWETVTTGRRESGPHEGEHCPNCEWEDHFGLLVHKGIAFGPNETHSVVAAKYAVDASSGDDNTVEALATDLATRAAIWSGYARGNVNMDDCVDLVDVCWLLSGNQVYPDDYNGDVDGGGGVGDGADADYLLQYVTGLGPAPIGGWRFTF